MRAPSRHVPRKITDLSMTNMVDVVFLLLVFFVWTSSFDIPDKDLPGPLARVATDSPNDSTNGQERQDLSESIRPDELVVTIMMAESSRVPAFGFGTRQVSGWTQLQSELKPLLEVVSSPPPIVLSPASDITMDQITTTIDSLRQIGWPTVSLLATEQ
ncbi:MAG: biopolymer transporter ExbD [Planctomycetota bacterium]